MSCFVLAEKLNRDISEVLEWSCEKIAWWLAYYEARERGKK